MNLPRAIRHAAPLTLLAMAIACGDGGTEPTAAPHEISPAANAYLTEVLDIMEAHSINRLTIDWPQLRTRAFAAAGAAQSVTQTLPGIRAAIAALGDGHTFYRAINGSVLFVPIRICQPSGTSAPAQLPANIGYVKVGAFGGTPTEATAFADNIQGTIRSADQDSLLGWIVDLRGNGGGNMWPMLAGLGPILGNGVLGWFIDPAGVENSWEYSNGASRLNGAAVQRATTPYTLKQTNPKVAVLVDNGVASSGEATFIAFRKRANTRSFGVATCGLSTANAGFRLSDGATLVLTTSVMADREKTPYGEQVPPDETIEETTLVVDRAIAWLQSGNPGQR